MLAVVICAMLLLAGSQFVECVSLGSQKLGVGSGSTLGKAAATMDLEVNVARKLGRVLSGASSTSAGEGVRDTVGTTKIASNQLRTIVPAHISLLIQVSSATAYLLSVPQWSLHRLDRHCVSDWLD